MCAKTGDGREIRVHIDKGHRDIPDMPVSEVDLAKTTHADLGKSPASRIPAPGAHTTIDNACAVVQFMVGGIEFLRQIGEIVKNFQCQFVNT